MCQTQEDIFKSDFYEYSFRSYFIKTVKNMEQFINSSDEEDPQNLTQIQREERQLKKNDLTHQKRCECYEDFYHLLKNYKSLIISSPISNTNEIEQKFIRELMLNESQLTFLSQMKSKQSFQRNNVRTQHLIKLILSFSIVDLYIFQIIIRLWIVEEIVKNTNMKNQQIHNILINYRTNIRKYGFLTNKDKQEEEKSSLKISLSKRQQKQIQKYVKQIEFIINCYQIQLIVNGNINEARDKKQIRFIILNVFRDNNDVKIFEKMMDLCNLQLFFQFSKVQPMIQKYYSQSEQKSCDKLEIEKDIDQTSLKNFIKETSNTPPTPDQKAKESSFLKIKACQFISPSPQKIKNKQRVQPTDILTSNRRKTHLFTFAGSKAKKLMKKWRQKDQQK